MRLNFVTRLHEAGFKLAPLVSLSVPLPPDLYGALLYGGKNTKSSRAEKMGPIRLFIERLSLTYELWWFSLTWILSWFVLLLISMWNNNTLIDAWFVLTHKRTMIFWITVYWMLMFVNVVSGAPPSRLCQCFNFHCCHVQPCKNTMYFECFSLTLTPLPWCSDLSFYTLRICFILQCMHVSSVLDLRLYYYYLYFEL